MNAPPACQKKTRIIQIIYDNISLSKNLFTYCLRLITRLQCLNSVVNTEGFNGQARDIVTSFPKAACYLSTTVAAAAAAVGRGRGGGRGGGGRLCQCKISMYKAHRYAQTNASYLQSIKMLHSLV